jgi:hypothetical protein
MPVTLAPGRARDATKPVPTGSFDTGKTIGMLAVARFAARASSVPAASMTSTLSRTNSAAISAKRSWRPSAQRYSIAMLPPSLQPSCRSRWLKATAHWPWVAGVPRLNHPMVGTRACCARAASGHAAAPPRSAMKLRRPMQNCPSRTKPTKGQRCASQQNWPADDALGLGCAKTPFRQH